MGDLPARFTIAIVHTRRSPCRCHRTVVAACRALGHRTVTVDSDRLPADLRRIRDADLAFDVTDAYRGSVRDRHRVRSMLERAGIPVAGSPARVLALCDDKPAAKRRLRSLGILTPPWIVLRSLIQASRLRHFAKTSRPSCLAPRPSPFIPRFSLLALRSSPLVLKPVSGHSSRDVALVHDFAELRITLRKILAAGDGPALAETFIPGREISVSLLEDGKGLRILPIRETLLGPATKGIYTRRAKQGPDSALTPHGSRVVAARLAPTLRRRLERTARRIWRGFGLRGWARIDLRLDAAGQPWVLEVNATPGLEPGSEFVEAARAGRAGFTTKAPLACRSPEGEGGKDTKTHQVFFFSAGTCLRESSDRIRRVSGLPRRGRGFNAATRRRGDAGNPTL